MQIKRSQHLFLKSYFSSELKIHFKYLNKYLTNQYTEASFDNKCYKPVKNRSLSFPFRGFLAVAASSSTVAT